MKTYRPGFKPVYTDEPEPAPAPKAAGPTQADLVKMAKAAADARHAAASALRQDGPTLEEYVAAGYLAQDYPPKGFAPNPLPKTEHEPVVVPPLDTSPPPTLGNDPLFGTGRVTELIPIVKPLPLIDNNAAPGDPALLAPGSTVDPLLK